MSGWTRADGQQVLDAISAGYLDRPGVEVVRRFGGDSLCVDGRIVAFVEMAGRLVVKLPAERVTAAVEAGDGERITIGRNPAREWVSFDRSADWTALVAESFAFVQGGAG